ncbi:MAG TPA: hypothetical protein DD407_14025 [Pseudohongiella sp.]|nr:hypothetical protein [Gammaproteobacteria bacterium]HBN16152.1 hypothetical protein [Pseudohongiella sp.]
MPAEHPDWRHARYRVGVMSIQTPELSPADIQLAIRLLSRGKDDLRAYLADGHPSLDGYNREDVREFQSDLDRAPALLAKFEACQQ